MTRQEIRNTRKKKRVWAELIIYEAVLLLAVVALPIILFTSPARFKENHVAVTATVAYISVNPHDYTVSVSYQYQEKLWNGDIGDVDKLPDDMQVGETLTVYLDPEKPQEPLLMPTLLDFKIVAIWLLMAALLVSMVVIHIGQHRADRLLKNGSPELKKTGKAVEARVTDCQEVQFGRKARETNYFFVVEYTDSKGKPHKAGTGLLDFNPKDYLRYKKNVIYVYINPEKPRKCYIDTEAILEYLNNRNRSHFNL